MKKCALTLIEVMIALGIASLLLAVLFPYFTHTMQLKKQIENEKAFVFSKAHVQERLATLFSQISNAHDFKTVQEEGKSKLEFLFNNGYAQDPQYRGNVTGYLYLEEDKLLLEIKGCDIASHFEVLLDNVKEIHFKFTDLEDGELSVKSTWDKNGLPLFFVLKTTFSDKEEAFYFRFKSLTPFPYPSKT